MAKKKTIFITRRMPKAVLERAKLHFNVFGNIDDNHYDSNALINKSQGADGLLICSNDKINRLTTLAFPEKIKIISCYTAGFENVDLEATKERNIVVTNSPDSVTEPTAEIAMLLMLGAARRGAEADKLIRSEKWLGWHTQFMIGESLSGKRLGIFGMGRIGQALANRARGFGLEIHYHNRSRLSPEVEAGAIFHNTSESLLKVSDILSLNCALTSETTNFLNEKRISLLPNRSIVINTARGEVIDDNALIQSLTKGKIYAAGLDVFKGEPKIDRRYLNLQNTFLLPHLGSATHDARNGMGFQAIDNLISFFSGKLPPNKVN